MRKLKSLNENLDYFYLALFLAGIILTYFVTRKINQKKGIANLENKIIIDTSSLIDGRILEVAKTGFLSGKLYIPDFVLEELQKVADSTDPLRRNKGRRGLKILKELQDIPYFEVKITKIEYENIAETDKKLITLAKEKQAKLLTVDYNLNEVAKIQGVAVLNINSLSNALKPAFLPGETLEVKVVQKGKERGQGVGYLEDGTMIVVENGEKFLGRKVVANVHRIFQTDAGRMIFCRPKDFRKEGTEESGPRKRFFRPRLPRFFGPKDNQR